MADPTVAAAEDWVFGPPDAEIRVRNAEALLVHLPFFLGGWPLRHADDTAPPDIDIVASPDPDNEAVTLRPLFMDADPQHFDNAFDAANGLSGLLISALLMHRPGAVCLHAGAAAIGGRLAICAGDSFSGKSSVALQMTVAGHRFFGDDRIVLHPGTNDVVATCMGLLPKVRLPLPEDAGPGFQEFIDSYKLMTGPDQVFLQLWEGEAATFGETAPLAAMYFLEREDGRATDISDIGASEAVRRLMANGHAPQMAAGEMLQTLNRLAQAGPTRLVRFSSSREAAAAIAGDVKQAAAV